MGEQPCWGRVMQAKIREAGPEEFNEVGSLTLEAYEALLSADGLHGYGADLLDVAPRAASGAVFVATDRLGALVGTVSYVRGPDTPMSEFDDVDGCGIRMLAVRPDRQRRGVGRGLVEACVERGRAELRGLVVLHTLTVMTAARSLYFGAGFRRAHLRDVVIPSDELDGDAPLVLMAYERIL